MNQHLYDFSDLPLQINNYADAKTSIKRFDGNLFLAKGHITRALALIASDERLYYMGDMFVTIMDRESFVEKRHSCTVFLSNRRFVIADDISPRGIIIPLCDLRSIEASTDIFKRISFRTPTKEITLIVVVNNVMIRELFIYVAGDLKDSHNVGVAVQPEPSLKKKRVVECRGCASAVIVIEGEISKCEYCGKYVD